MRSCCVDFEKVQNLIKNRYTLLVIQKRDDVWNESQKKYEQISKSFLHLSFISSSFFESSRPKTLTTGIPVSPFGASAPIFKTESTWTGEL